jgi:hypothetical protein
MKRSDSAPPTPSRPWPQLVLLVVVFMTFGQLVPHDFVQWDDPFHLTVNARMNPATSDTLAYYWRHGDGTMYNPVTYTIWAALTFAARVPTADPQGVTLNPMIFHAFNVLVHSGSALLVFGILMRLTRHRIAALLGALIFSLHPVQVEAVGWISGLKDLLWGFFSFAAIYCYLIYTHDGRRAFYFGGMVLLGLAMLSKPTAMVTPAVIIAIDRLLLHRPWKRIALDAGPWLALSVPCMIIARLIQTGSRAYAGPLWARPLIAADSLAFYAGKLLWPLDLAPDYGHRPAAVMAEGLLYWTWIVPLVLAALAIWQLRRRPWIAAGLAVFVIATLPTLGWIPFSFQYYSTVGDHYLYVSMFGIGVIVAYFVANSRWPMLRVAAGVGVAIALLAGRARWQTQVWADTPTLFTHTVAVNPDSFIARIQLALVHVRNQRPDLAEPMLRKAIELEPTLPRGYQALSSVLWSLQKHDEAIPVLAKYVELQSKIPRERRPTLADSCVALGRYYLERNDTATAAVWFRYAANESPEDPDVIRWLAKAVTAPTRRP